MLYSIKKMVKYLVGKWESRNFALAFGKQGKRTLKAKATRKKRCKILNKKFAQLKKSP